MTAPILNLTQRLPARLQKILRLPALALALAVSLLAALYWGLIASDRYVSEARVLIQSTDMGAGQALDLGNLLAGTGNASARGDQLLLRERLLSVDMMQRLDQQLQLREHYSSDEHDILSRLFWHESSQEFFHRYYLKRVSVDYDEYAGTLIVQAQAFAPEMAHRITQALVQEGEQFMNLMGHQLAQEQVEFLEQQVKERSQQAQEARQRLLAYQNKKGLLSPQATAENLAAIVNKLEAQLTDLAARKAALLGYLAPSAPGVVEIDLQIKAVEKQIQTEQQRLTSPRGQTLNRAVEEFQRLEMEAAFAQDTYKSALLALEKGRINATRKLKKVSVLQSPTEPEYPLRPRRLYNIATWALAALLLAGIAQLLMAIVRDHKD
ncbi:chain-length determining protein [Comamonas composti]|uniref:chain-length determining protein n=1 Tax=Comamonas composti TaxID=408558 RepID=UPI000403EF4A|nr:chain-length determining protein [Comamonas composti]